MHEAHYEEIRLSRELVKAIGQELESVPQSVMAAYTKLLQHYAKEIEEGVQ